ncbi:MAG: MFS transporter [Acidobacteria bacterium]|nr:MFS transporter [Acidobacteriota bacterium]
MEQPRSPALLYAIFFATGIATVQMGLVLPQMHSRSLGDSAIGLLLAMQFSGQLAGALFVGRRPARAVIYGMALTVLTAIVLAFPRGLHPATLLLFGLGLGITMTAINILAGREVTPAARIRRLQILNVFWPVGAAAAPWFIRGSTRILKQPERSYAALALCTAVLLLFFALRFCGKQTSVSTQHDEEHRIRISQLALFCLFAALAVGIEASLANWIPTFAVRYLSGTTAASLAATAFWCGILSGRFIADKSLQRVSWRTFGVLSSVLCALAVCGILASHSTPVFIATAFLAAFFVAPLYPAVLAHSVHVRWKNAVFVAAGCGSALIPWLVGQTSVTRASLRTAMFLPAIAAILLATALLLGVRHTMMTTEH